MSHLRDGDPRPYGSAERRPAGSADVPADQRERETALDVDASFIVQAPAGSGKTGLLMQRYLALLARVDHPEEIVAITFTRKAAGEMRERVLGALEEARRGSADAVLDTAHDRTTRALARAALARDEAAGWSLASQPRRLRILTIDALCRSIATQMPWLSRIGGDARIVEDVGPLYRRAARRALGMLHDETPWSEHVATLLAHLDGDVARLEALLVEMLARRDQWLRYLLPGAMPADARRAELEAELERAVAGDLDALRRAVPPALAGELAAVCAFGAGNLRAAGAVSPGAACAELDSLPGAAVRDLRRWQGVAEIFLTQKGEWRSRLGKAQGFPPGKEGRSAAMRERAKALLADLDGAGALRERLHAVRGLPEPAYTPAQWRVLEALLATLPVATAHLRVVFGERGEVDYIEVANAARQALGTDEAPTDLALALDYRIRHLLVDEFQDTSHTHFALLCQLTAGWTPGDGRTLFLVGDPMQSIYRFREADVGVFLDVRRRGLGGVATEPLTLSANFRSGAGIVAWVNDVYPRIMPGSDDPVSGAVAYSPASVGASRAAGETPGGVHLHALAGGADAQARRVVDLVRAARTRDPGEGVAVLVRTRSQLAGLLPRLRAAGLRYRGVDIERLSEVPVVEDLLALARALLHPADRVAWLAVLRAPWCGLTLADLCALVGEDRSTPVAGLLRDRVRLDRMSADGRGRALRARAVLEAALAERGRQPLRGWIEGTWHALGGPACIDGGELVNAEALLELLESMDGDDGLPDADELGRRAAELFAVTEAGETDVEVMTIHKAKGLEFDTVIVPGLERTARAEERRLLAWTKRAGEPEDLNILLAPLPSPAEDEPPIYDYLRRLERRKADHERARLLYVATTRARRALHLVAGVDPPDEGETPPGPPRGSLLACLWPALADEFLAAHEAAPRVPLAEASLRGDDGPRAAAWRRLPDRWAPPPPPPAARPAPDTPARRDEEPTGGVIFDWAGESARRVGTVVHATLRRMAEQGPDVWDAGRLHRQRPAWRAMLASLGIPRRELAGATARVEEALAKVLDDPRGRWLLDPEHAQAHSELALGGIDRGGVVGVVIDRTFVDADGVRWIVDYKSGRHAGGDLDRFLDREQQRYRAQLERYARLVARMDARPIRLGLYFPAVPGWREWAYDGAGRG